MQIGISLRSFSDRDKGKFIDNQDRKYVLEAEYIIHVVNTIGKIYKISEERRDLLE